MCEVAAKKNDVRHSICFVDPEQKDEVIQIFKNKYIIHNFFDVNKLSQYTTCTTGILILDPSHSVGVNTKFGLTSDVYTCCSVKNMP